MPLVVAMLCKGDGYVSVSPPAIIHLRSKIYKLGDKLIKSINGDPDEINMYMEREYSGRDWG